MPGIGNFESIRTDTLSVGEGGDSSSTLTVDRSVDWAGINYDNIRDLSTVTPTGDGSLFCSFDTSAAAGTDYNYGHLSGYQDRMAKTGAGTLDDRWSFYSCPAFDGGNVARRYGVNILDPTGAAAIALNVGVFIAALSRGTANYAIYTNGHTPSHFGGNVGIGGTEFDASSTHTLLLKNGVAPAAHVDNGAQLFSTDTSDATATLGLMLEQQVEAIGSFTASHKIKIKINGVEYWLQLDAVV